MKSVEDRQSQLTLETVNEECGRKSTLRAKLKSASQEERKQKRKEHLKNLHENPSKFTHKPMKKL